jgi:hypothetical protein
MTWEVEVIPSVAFGVAASKRAGLCGWTALAAMGSGRGLRPHLLLHSRVSSCASWYWYAVEAAVGAVTALALMRGEDHARPCDGLVRHARGATTATEQKIFVATGIISHGLPGPRASALRGGICPNLCPNQGRRPAMICIVQKASDVRIAMVQTISHPEYSGQEERLCAFPFEFGSERAVAGAWRVQLTRRTCLPNLDLA